MYLTMPFKKNKNLYKSIVFIHYWRAWNILPCYVSKNSYYVCTLTQLWKFVLIIGISLGTFISIEDEIFSVLKNILYIHEEFVFMSYLNIYTLLSWKSTCYMWKYILQFSQYILRTVTIGFKSFLLPFGRQRSDRSKICVRVLLSLNFSWLKWHACALG